jgi:hypothetical protein
MNGKTGHQAGVVLINGGVERDEFSMTAWLASWGDRPSERLTIWLTDGSLWISCVNLDRQGVVDPSRNIGELSGITSIVPGTGA